MRDVTDVRGELGWTIREPTFIANMRIEEYAADPAPRPSLDTRSAVALRDRSPLHARHGHPWFDKDAARPTRRMDIGSAFHSLVLEGRIIHTLVPFDDFKTKKAREFRDAEIDEGKVPLLEPDYRKLEDMIEAFIRQGGYDILGGTGKPELSGFFMSGGAWCRTRPDWTDTVGPAVRFVQLKTVTGDAGREAVEKRFHRDGWDLSAALNAEAASDIWGREASVSWLLVEQEPPHAISCHTFNAASLMFARGLLRKLAARWGQCLAMGRFPGYYVKDRRDEITYRKWDLDRVRIMAGVGPDDA